jgi:hypothetical protein
VLAGKEPQTGLPQEWQILSAWLDGVPEEPVF